MTVRLTASRAALLPLPLIILVSVALHDGGRQGAEHERRVDKIFADVDVPDSPGCAVSVMRRGAIVYRRGYGMANLEYDIPITPSSIFHVASVSKQFTAMAVALLAAEGAVAWGDDIRKYVPEVPDHGAKITLRDLAHHVSGIRDQWELLILAGWRWEADVVREEDVLDVISRQRALNFQPGEEWLYSNTGYTLLAAVVQRVSGLSLREFAEQRIFQPLGMSDTHFHDDHQHIVENRAYAYAPDSLRGWRISIPDFAIVGASSLFTTVEDLARWDRNFYTGHVGGPEVLDLLQERAVLADGDTVSYAYGLGFDTYRGLPVVGHSGADAGYRARFVRFPQQELSIALLCNYPSSSPWDKAWQVADIYLEDALADPADADEDEGPTGIQVPEGRLRALEGYYISPHSDFPLHIRLRDGKLVWGRFAPEPLLALAADSFQAGGSVLRFEGFSGGVPGRLRVSGSTLERTYTRAAPPDTSNATLQELTGTYYSDELEVSYLVKVMDGKLVLWNRKLGDVPVAATHERGFSAEFWSITFTRDAGGSIDGFTISTPRVRKVIFTKR